MHDNTLWHGITEVTSGTKYSLLFFFDEPPLKNTGIKAIFQNQASINAALYWKGNPGFKLVSDNWEPGESIAQGTYKNHEFVAKDL